MPTRVQRVRYRAATSAAQFSLRPQESYQGIRGGGGHDVLDFANGVTERLHRRREASILG